MCHDGGEIKILMQSNQFSNNCSGDFMLTRVFFQIASSATLLEFVKKCNTDEIVIINEILSWLRLLQIIKNYFNQVQITSLFAVVSEHTF